MRRSIISLCVFVFLVVLVAGSEALYTKNLANAIDSYALDFHGMQSVEGLSELFESRKIMNRIFLKESIIERFEIYIKELEIYTKAGQSADAKNALEKIKFYTKDLHEFRSF